MTFSDLFADFEPDVQDSKILEPFPTKQHFGIIYMQCLLISGLFRSYFHHSGRLLKKILLPVLTG